jgi:AcrR family transcriptional regulator
MVLDAAFELFLEHGYEGTSMDAIARAAGVTKPVVYDCFPSKQQLFNALLRREEERVLAEVTAALGTATDLSDPERTLTEGITAFLRAVAASPQAYRVIFLGEGAGNAAVTRRVQRGREQQVEAVALLARGWLATGDGGQITDDAELDAEARLIGQVVVSLAEAGARLLLADGEHWTPESLGETLGGLAARGQDSYRSIA